MTLEAVHPYAIASPYYSVFPERKPHPMHWGDLRFLVRSVDKRFHPNVHAGTWVVTQCQPPRFKYDGQDYVYLQLGHIVAVDNGPLLGFQTGEIPSPQPPHPPDAED